MSADKPAFSAYTRGEGFLAKSPPPSQSVSQR